MDALRFVLQPAFFRKCLGNAIVGDERAALASRGRVKLMEKAESREGGREGSCADSYWQCRRRAYTCPSQRSSSQRERSQITIMVK